MPATPQQNEVVKNSSSPAKKKRFRIPVRLAFTREGKWFCWITLAVGFAAINTGNNLLFLLLGMMLSLIVISGILCNISLNRLDVKRMLPRQVFASTPCLVSLSVTNQKRFFPSFSIEVEDRIAGQERGKKCYFLKVGAEQTQTTAYRLSLPRRGHYQFSEIRISSKFPFSLFNKTHIMSSEEEFLVFPEVYPVTVPSGAVQRSFGMVSSSKRGQGSDFFALREMRPGDELRWIHWPSTARTGVFQVRQFEDENRLQIELVLWHSVLEKSKEAGENLDNAIDFTASLLYAFFQRQQPVQFSTLEQHFSSTEQTSSLESIWRHLALLEPHDVRPPNLSSSGGGHSFLVVVPENFSTPQGIPQEHILRTTERVA